MLLPHTLADMTDWKMLALILTYKGFCTLPKATALRNESSWTWDSDFKMALDQDLISLPLPHAIKGYAVLQLQTSDLSVERSFTFSWGLRKIVVCS